MLSLQHCLPFRTQAYAGVICNALAPKKDFAVSNMTTEKHWEDPNLLWGYLYFIHDYQ